MSNKTQLSNNNDKLASLIQELANKAAGGGGASVETCTVVITGNNSSVAPAVYAYSTLTESGEITCVRIAGNTDNVITIDNVICGSFVAVYLPNGFYSTYTSENAEVTNMGTAVSKCIKINAPAGGQTTVHFVDNSSSSG